MKVHHVGNNGVAVYIETMELEEYCPSGEELDEQRARQLALQAMRQLGVNSRGSLEIEAYTGQGGTMLFVLLDANDEPEDATAYFVFDNMDNALDGITYIKKLKDSGLRYALYTPDNRPVLAVRGTQRVVAAAGLILCEFGEKRGYPPEYEIFLRERTR